MEFSQTFARRKEKRYTNAMNKQTLQPYFLPILLIGGLTLSFFIFRPFLTPLILAVILAVVFYPLHHRIERMMPKFPGFSAFLTLLVVVGFIVTPLAFLGVQIFGEVEQLYTSLVVDNGGGQGGLQTISRYLTQTLHQIAPISGNVTIDITQYLKGILGWLFQNLGAVFSNIASIGMSFFIMLIALYYLLKDGVRLKKMLIVLSPLSDSDDENIFRRLGLAINSVVKGNITVAILQGIVASIGFTIFGVPNPILWGTIASVFALVPPFGTSLILIPSVVFLYFGGHVIQSAGLLVWAVLAVGLIDNILGPTLVGKGIKLHPLLVLLSVLGGLAFFGPIGFLLGPLTLSFVITLFDTYAPSPTA